MATAFSSKLILPAALEQVPPVLAYVEELALVMGFDSQERSQIRLALEEMLSNVIHHGYAEDPEGTYTLECRSTASGLEMVILEKGLPFEPDKMPSYHPDKDSILQGAEGLGSFLAHKAVDKITYRNLGRQGWEISLVKNLGAGHVSRRMGLESPGEAIPDPQSSGHSPGPDDYLVREMRPDDALEVSQCAYRTYGYGYEDFIYYPEQIVEMNRRGLMISQVAVSREGRIVGHLALKREDPEDVLGELGALFVTPRWRGAGVARRLHLPLFAAAEEHGLSGVFVRAVAGHTASQQLAPSLRLAECAIMLGCFPAKVKFKGLTDELPHRMSGLVMWRPVGPPRRRVIYPPPRHQAWVERLYGHLGLPYEEGEGAAPGPARQDERLEVCKNEVLKVATITAPEMDEDTSEQVQQVLRRLLRQGTDLILCQLNLEDPGTPTVAQRLMEMGFFFAGILPEALRGKDALVLQCPNNLPIDYTGIKLAGSLARELLAYIRDQDEFNREDNAP